MRKEGVWVTALGGLALHVCTSFITNRRNMVRTQTYPDKAQRSVYIVCSDLKGEETKTAMSLVSWSGNPVGCLDMAQQVPMNNL